MNTKSAGRKAGRAHSPSCKKQRRNQSGSAIAEFGAAFVVLVIFFFIPLINLSFIGVRYLIASTSVNEFTHRLALSEKRSEAYSRLSTDDSWSNFAASCGVNVTNKKLRLVVCGSDAGDMESLPQGQAVQSEYLPGGTKAPCLYNLELTVQADINPVYGGGPGGIPGITSPVPMKIVARSAWENLSKNPITKEYFINE